MLAKQSASVIRSAWSQVMRGNPFAFLGTSFGIEPTDRLPGPVQILSLLLESKSIADLTREWDRVFDDVGYERKTFFVEAKPEEQSLEDFTEGAKMAFDRVVAGDVSPEALGEELRELKVEVKGDATRAEVKRVTFAVKADVALEDLQPRPRPWWDVLDSWRCDYSDRVDMYNGVFSATFQLNRDVAELIEDVAKARNIDPAKAIGVLFREREVTWPSDPLKIQDYVGFVLVDVDFDVMEPPQDEGPLTVHVFRKSKWTFARRVDPRPAARWDYDWRVVDVDEVVTKGDWRNLSRLFA